MTIDDGEAAERYARAAKHFEDARNELEPMDRGANHGLHQIRDDAKRMAAHCAAMSEVHAAPAPVPSSR